MIIKYLSDRAQGPLSKISTAVYDHIKKVGEIDLTALVNAFSHPRSDTYVAIEELKKLNAVEMCKAQEQLIQQQAA